MTTFVNEQFMGYADKSYGEYTLADKANAMGDLLSACDDVYSGFDVKCTSELVTLYKNDKASFQRTAENLGVEGDYAQGWCELIYNLENGVDEKSMQSLLSRIDAFLDFE